MMTDEQIDELVGIIGQSMHGEVDAAGMRRGDKAMASLIADALKALNHISADLHEINEALRVVAKAKAFEVANRGGGL